MGEEGPSEADPRDQIEEKRTVRFGSEYPAVNTPPTALHRPCSHHPSTTAHFRALLKRLSLKYHPDKNVVGLQWLFSALQIEINSASMALGDER